MMKSPSEYLTTENMSPLSRQRPQTLDAGLGEAFSAGKAITWRNVIESSLLKVGNFRRLKGRKGWRYLEKRNFSECSLSSVLGVSSTYV
ncbi:hypothetical protein CEXT_775301 [Caerostris extrusa]|uniref:Uncharacterized protein n=1 Tax=Caerostris extrusa TaxID=172846 RepID=A0AAV4MJL6_CAEEX|nr:hypothetical protein CEXT_775301 [Caerostris extrusa]